MADILFIAYPEKFWIGRTRPQADMLNRQTIMLGRTCCSTHDGRFELLVKRGIGDLSGI